MIRVTTYYGVAMKSRFLRLVGVERAKPLNHCLSLDIPLDSEDSNSTTVIDKIPSPDDGIADVIEAEYQTALKVDVDGVLKSLTPTGELIVRCKFWQNMTFADIERAHGLGEKEVRREFIKSMNSLRRGRNRNKLIKYRSDIISRYAYRSSFASWRDAGTSSTERAVFQLMERGVL